MNNKAAAVIVRGAYEGITPTDMRAGLSASPHDIYICRSDGIPFAPPHGTAVNGTMCMIDDIEEVYSFAYGDIEHYVDFYGRSQIRGVMAEMSCELHHIAFNYTEHMRRYMAALRIQAQWRMYKRRKAVRTISDAYLAWKDRMKTRFNPTTFVGVVDLYISYIRLRKE